MAGEGCRRDRPEAGRTRRAGPTLYYIAAAVLAAMVPLILFAGLWVRTVLNQNDRDLRAYLASHVEALSARLDQDIERQWSVLRAIAPTPSLDAPDLAGFQVAAERMVGVVPHGRRSASSISTSGRQLVSTLRPYGSDSPPLRSPEVARQVAETGRPAVVVRYPGESPIDERGGIFLAVPITRDSGLRLVLFAAMWAEAIQGVLEAVSEEAARRPGRRAGPDPRPVAGAGDVLRRARQRAAAQRHGGPRRRAVRRRHARRHERAHRLPALVGHRLARRPGDDRARPHPPSTARPGRWRPAASRT